MERIPLIEIPECKASLVDNVRAKHQIDNVFKPVFEFKETENIRPNLNPRSSILLLFDPLLRNSPRKTNTTKKDEYREEVSDIVNDIIENALDFITKTNNTTVPDFNETHTLIKIDSETPEDTTLLQGLDETIVINEQEDIFETLERNKLLEEKALKEQEVEANNKKIQELKEKISKETTEIDANKKKLEEIDEELIIFVTFMRKFEEDRIIAEKKLAAFEVVFAKVHEKYEKCKSIISELKTNEEEIKANVARIEEVISEYEEKYQAYKQNCEQEINSMYKTMRANREKEKDTLRRLLANNKRMEIKIVSLTNNLEQKTKECTALTKLLSNATEKIN